MARRQMIRRGVLFVMFLLFPVVLNFLSPYLIIEGAQQGIAAGSFVLFTLLFVSSLILGRAYCGWVCPAGALQECLASTVQRKQFHRGKADWIKYFIWTPWIGFIIFLFVQAGGIRTVDALYLTESGISVDRAAGYIVYLPVVFILMILGIVLGRRGACHTICWLSPFMIVGRGLRNLVQWPSLRLEGNKEACTSCLTCNTVCSMSLDVNGLVQRQNMEEPECILCGECVDHCPEKVIRYGFGAGFR
jgi:polyferredoxin